MRSLDAPLDGKVAVVTGGARGIGFGLAQALSDAGCRVAIGDLDGAEAAAARLGGAAIGAPLDVSDRPAFSAFLDAVERRLGPLDVLINNAGIMPVGSLLEEDDATAVRMVEINFHGVLHGTKEAMRRMVPRGRGQIVNIASIAGRTGYPQIATYSATKHAVVGLSEAAKAELRGTGVEISVVLPVFVETELAAGMGEIRGFGTVSVHDVVYATIDALRLGRYDVYLPRSARPALALVGLLPRRARELVGRALGIDRVLLGADSTARAAYEARAAASAPGADRRGAAATGEQEIRAGS